MFLYNVIYPLFFTIITQVLYLVSGATIRDYAADVGANITIPCAGLSKLTNVDNVMWVFRGKGDRQISNHTIKLDGGLLLHSVSANDTGNYSCSVEGKGNNNSLRLDDVIARLTVRTSPPILANVTVHLSTILGLVLWDVAGDGGVPLQYFTAEYRSTVPLADGTLEPWRPISPNRISPNARQIDVYHLEPNSSYLFRVWAANTLGTSPAVEVLGHTLYSDTEAELRRHLLLGAEEFDTRVWVAAVAVVMGTLCVLTLGTCLLLYRECRSPHGSEDDQDVMELVPNIILNPGFVESQTIIGTAPCAVVIRTGKYSRANGTAQPRKV